MGQKPIFENKNRDKINSKIKSYNGFFVYKISKKDNGKSCNEKARAGKHRKTGGWKISSDSCSTPQKTFFYEKESKKNFGGRRSAVAEHIDDIWKFSVEFPSCFILYMIYPFDDSYESFWKWSPRFSYCYYVLIICLPAKLFGNIISSYNKNKNCPRLIVIALSFDNHSNPLNVFRTYSAII